MVKICRSCLSMFEGNIPIEHCPMRDCGGWELIKIDDMLVDVIRKFWMVGISTVFCCSGHLYKPSFSPHVKFDAARDDEGRQELEDLRDMFMELENELNRVDISEIEPLRDMHTLTVRAKQCENDPMERLNVQNDFIEFLYDVVEFVKTILEEGQELEPCIS